MRTSLLVSEVFPPRTGGSGRWFWEIYRRLPREHFVIAAGEAERQTEFDQSHDLHVVRVPLTLSTWGICNLKGLSGYWRAIAHLNSISKSRRAKVVHCGRCLPEGLMALALRYWCGIRYLCYVHGEEMNYATMSKELSFLMRQVLHRSELVIANSRNTAQILKTEWALAPDKIRQLYPGVDTGRFQPAARDAKVRNELGWGDRPVILTVGRLQKRKGHDVMILALQQIRRHFPDALYAIVGDGEERGPLQQLVFEQGLANNAQFLGELSDDQLVRCYQQCDLFVLPNRQVGKDIEGFGMVLLEAQACGKPVIAGTSGGTEETMRVPQTGRVVSCENPDELSQAVIALLSSPADLKQMGAQARQWVKERFDWNALSKQAARVFESLSSYSNGRSPTGPEDRSASGVPGAAGRGLQTRPFVQTQKGTFQGKLKAASPGQ